MISLIVDYVDLQAQWEEDKGALLPVLVEVLESGQYILGQPVDLLENALAEACGVEHCVTVNSGTDALVIAIAALGIGRGDEVITPPNSFVASAAAVAHLGATPVFVDVLANQLMDPAQVRKAITPRTKAIMPVHLSGRMCRMNEFDAISRETGIPVVEDAAQSMGSRFLGRASGSWGVVGCFSAHPLKNLAAVGDAGFLVTRNAEIAEYAKRVRNHGLVDRTTVPSFGVVSRLDSLKAAVLCYRLGKLDSVIERRRHNAEIYLRELADVSIDLPVEDEAEFNTYHTFVVQVDERDALKEFLESRGVGTAIHYPVPIHLQPAASKYGHGLGSFPVCESQALRILSLPIHQNLELDQLLYVCSCIKDFYG